MAAIIDRRPVHKNKVLVHATTPDTEPCGSLARGLYPRHHLDDPDDVVLTHKGRQAFHQGRIHSLFAELRDLKIIPLCL